MDEVRIAEEFYRNTFTYFSDGLEYESVFALLIHWRDNDIAPDREIAALRKLFEDDYNFEVTTFPIPTQGGQQRLALEISSIVYQWSNKLNSLIIIYYAGHCFISEKGEARWAAYENGHSSLSWSACQHSLFGALGDVLIILDCCEAAVYSKGSKEQGRFEILAASAKGVPTPEPGAWSFTSFLIRELRRNKDRRITVRELASLLWEQDHIQQTPFWGDLVRKSHISITLQPLRKKTQHSGFMKKPSSDIFFRVSLTGDITGLEIADWLKTAPPKAITAVNIEAVVLKARTVQRQEGLKPFPPGSIFNKLPDSARKEILQQFQELNTVMAKSTSDARSSVTKSDDETISRAYESIAHAVSAVCSAIETPILLDLGPEDLEAALHDKSAIAAGAADSITLRQSLLQSTAVSHDLELPREEVKLENSECRFRTGFVAGKTILAEFFSYAPKPENSDPYRESVEQVQRMTALLCHPKRTGFHILPCMGYVHDKVNHKFGLVFETPPQSESDKTICLLQELYESRKTLALGDRISLSYKLTVAVESFHRVGWVHKALRSSNILFLPSAESLIHISDERKDGQTTTPIEPIDLSTPWLFGFEYARAQAAGTKLVEDYNTYNNLYRHPYRWGRPTVKFTKAHDVYSLGVVLFEIACWKHIKALIKLTETDHQHIQSHEIARQIEQRCRSKLPFQVGKMFAEIILSCLHFEETTKDMNEYEGQKYFQKSILQKLERMVGVL